MRYRRPGIGRVGRSLTLVRYALTAILGLTGRRAPGLLVDHRRRAESSSFEMPADAANSLQFGRAYQLPPFGFGNALDALFWTRTASLPPERIAEVLAALRAEDIPGWVAPAPGYRSAGPPAADRPHDLWVASGRLDAAQDVLMRVLGA